MEETFLRSPTIIRNSISTTLHFYLPLSRYIAGDYAELRSDEEDFDYEDAGGGETADDDDYGAWGPLLVLDVIWNLAFVLVSFAVLCWTVKERPSTPLRVWIGGYGLQCFLHVGFVYSEYRRKIKMESYVGGHHHYGGVSASYSYYISIAKKLETVNTLASSFWWVLGFYWIVGGGPSLLVDSPRLYWLAVVYLALDIFFMIFCIGIACIICLVLFFCIPVVAIAYAMTIREGASEDDIGILPKYRFCESFPPKILDNDLKHYDADTNSVDGIPLHSEDCECCICLTRYVQGAELCTLPCNHHFHSSCISKWLRINATCPLCKFNILKGDQAV